MQTREHIILSKEVGIKYIIVYINKMDFRVSGDMRELVELEVCELLDNYGFPAEKTPFVSGSARMALEEEDPTELGTVSVKTLMNIVDDYIQQPVRMIDAPLIFAVEGVLVVKGRGTVVTGKIEQGKILINDD